MRAEEFLHTLRASSNGQSGEIPAVCFDGAKVPWKCADCPYAAEFLAEANKTSYAEQLRFYDKEGRKREKKTLFDKLFPQGSRRRSAAKKLFRR